MTSVLDDWLGLNNHSQMTKRTQRLWLLVRADDPEARCRAAEELLALHGVKVSDHDRGGDLLFGLRCDDSNTVDLATRALETLIDKLQKCGP